jgi:hypothetical protein
MKYLAEKKPYGNSNREAEFPFIEWKGERINETDFLDFLI